MRLEHAPYRFEWRRSSWYSSKNRNLTPNGERFILVGHLIVNFGRVDLSESCIYFSDGQEAS